MQVSSSTRNNARFLFLALSVCLLSGCPKRVDGVMGRIERNQTGGLTIKSRLADGEKITANVIGGDTNDRIMCYCPIGGNVTFNSPSAVSISKYGWAFDVEAKNIDCNPPPK